MRFRAPTLPGRAALPDPPPAQGDTDPPAPPGDVAPPRPAAEISTYQMMWPNSPTGPIPDEVTRVYLGFVTEQGEWRDGVTQHPPGVRERLEAFRARGGTVGVSVGGEGGGHVLWDDPRALARGLNRLEAEWGQIKWVDFDLESNVGSPYLFQRACESTLSAMPHVKLVATPGGAAIEYWYDIIPQAVRYGLYEVAHQYYDNPSITIADILWRVRLAREAGVPRVTLGMKLQHRNILDWAGVVLKVKERYPDVSSAFLWEVGDPMIGEWARAMKGVL